MVVLTISVAIAKGRSTAYCADTDELEIVENPTVEQVKEAPVADEPVVNAEVSTTVEVPQDSNTDDSCASANEDEATRNQDETTSDDLFDSGDVKQADRPDGQQASAVAESTQPFETVLSVQPFSSSLPADRPSWITREPDYHSSTHSFVVGSIQSSRKGEVEDYLDVALEESVRSYANQLIGDDHAGELLSARLTAAFVRTNLLDDDSCYSAEVVTNSGLQHRKWVMVEITKEQQEVIRTWYQEQIQRRRVGPLAVVFLSILGMVGVSNLVLRRSAGRHSQTSAMQVKAMDVPTSKCKRSGWGYVVAIAVAIATACFVAV